MREGIARALGIAVPAFALSACPDRALDTPLATADLAVPDLGPVDERLMAFSAR
jgi:hypothetical protein